MAAGQFANGLRVLVAGRSPGSALSTLAAVTLRATHPAVDAGVDTDAARAYPRSGL